jgi:sigma-B regulation protein RsbU (phosphoserine phosphatase)
MTGRDYEKMPVETVALDGRVLVVDDEPTNRLTLQLVLKKAGCTVQVASSGPEGLELAQRTPPDLALVDVMMPGMDGFEVCRQLKQNKKTSDIPVIMVTSLQDVDDLEKGFKAGATDYVTKPFRARELLARVRNTLMLKQKTDTLRRQTQRLSSEMELAGRLQAAMLSLPPFLESSMLASFAYQPSMNVSGDVYDRVFLPDGRVCVYLADAAGHGVAAALMSSFLKSATQEVVRSFDRPEPAAVCKLLNTRFLATIKHPTAYATLFLGIYDPQTAEWTCMNCGHPSPILVSADGAVSTPFETGGGLPIGLCPPKFAYRKEDEVTQKVSPGDMLFLYTDGLIEAKHRETGEECQTEQLADVMRALSGRGLSINLSAEIISAVGERGYDIGEDDCSMVVLQMLDPGEMVYDEHIPATFDDVQKMAAGVDVALIEKGWPTITGSAIELLLNEHCNNAVEHGRLTVEDQLFIHIHVQGDACILSIEDPGGRWDYSKRLSDAEEMPEDTCESGRGVAIVRRIAREHVYFRDENQNVAFFVVPKEVSL